MTSFLGVPILVAGEPYGNLYLTDKQGAEEFGEDDEEAVVLLAEFAGVAIDHARRYTGVETQREALQQTVAALDATIQIARAVGGETDLAHILELVAKRGRALVSARALVIEHLSGDQLVVAAAAGELPPGPRPDRRPADTAWPAPRSGRCARSGSRTSRTGALRAPRARAARRAREGRPGGPAGVPRHAYGVLVAIDRLEDGPRVQRRGSAPARGVRRQRRHRRGHRGVGRGTSARASALAAAEHERGRWARELHDETLQEPRRPAPRAFGGTRAAEGDPTGLDGRVGQAVDQLDERDRQAASADHRPAPRRAGRAGAEAAIESLAERATPHGLEVDVSIDLAYERAGDTAPDAGLEIADVPHRPGGADQRAQARRRGRAVVEVTRTRARAVERARRRRGFDPRAPDRRIRAARHARADAARRPNSLVIDSVPGQETTVTTSFPTRHPADEVSASAG